MEKEKTGKRRFSLRYLLGGLALVIISVLVLFSPGSFLFGLAYIFVFPFGWIGMYLLGTYMILLGLALIFHRRIALKYVPVIVGAVLSIFGAMILASHVGNGGNEAFKELGGYVEHFQTVATTSLGSGLANDPAISGGVFGYMLAAVLNEGLGGWAVYLISIATIVISAVLLAMPIILFVFKVSLKSIKVKKAEKAKQKERAAKEAALNEMVQEREKEMTPFIAPEDIDNSFFENNEESESWKNPLDKFKFTPASSKPVPSASEISRARSKSAYTESDYAPKEIKGGSINMSTPLTTIGLQEAVFNPFEGNASKESKPIEAETLPSSEPELDHPNEPVHHSAFEPERLPSDNRDHVSYYYETPPKPSSSSDLAEPFFGDNPNKPVREEVRYGSSGVSSPNNPSEEVSPNPIDAFYENLTAPIMPSEEERVEEPKEEEPVIDEPIEEEVRPEPAPAFIEPEEPVEEETLEEEDDFRVDFDEEPIGEEEPEIPTPVQPIFNRNRNSFMSQNEQPKPAPAPAPVPAPEPEPEEDDGMVMPKAKPLAPYAFPETSLLKVYEDTVDMARIENTCCIRAAAIDKKFADLGLGAHVSGYTVGPSVTRFDIETDPNVSVTSITRFMKDISKAMGGVSTRFTEIVPGKTTSAIEVVNQEEDRRLIPFSTCLAGLPTGAKYNLAIPFGVDIENKVVWGDLSKFPHMLVAGTTGSGKSIFIQGILMSLVMRNRPEDVKLMLVDPKRVEFSKYRDIPHLLCRIIKEAKEARIALQKLCDEMDRRYSLFENAGVSEIREFNSDYCEPNGLEKLPFIILVVDEFADLVEQEKDVNSSVMRLSAKARACGIHLIICTQRPDVKVINGTIKNNLGTRVALHLKTPTDSITILNQAGAEELLDHGDMLVDCDKISREFVRVQGCMVHNHEITAVTNHLRSQMQVTYSPIFNDFTDPNEKKNIAESVNDGSGSGVNLKEDSFEVVYEYVRDEIMKMDSTSISRIQRQFRVGYPRASEIMNKLVEEGIVAAKTDAPNSSKPSEVLIHSLEELNGEEPAQKGPGSYSSSFTTPNNPYGN
ncbi:MAG: hypothetical protein K6B65_07220 [Bacilli bacterium]|nr:hypothetical protein [Bacilli bacterium]